jgi:hypothetical protein
VFFLPLPTARTTLQFGGDVDLRGCTYDRIRVDWKSLLQYPNGLSRVKPYDRQPYVQLESDFRKSGLEFRANEVYLERRTVEDSLLRGTAKFWDNIYWYLGDWGNDLWHEFWIALVFIFLGSLVFLSPEAVQKRENESPGKKISVGEAISLSIQLFLPIKLPAEPDWSPSRHRIPFLLYLKSSSFGNFLSILGWVLIPLGVAFLAGVLRRPTP